MLFDYHHHRQRQAGHPLTKTGDQHGETYETPQRRALHALMLPAFSLIVAPLLGQQGCQFFSRQRLFLFLLKLAIEVQQT
jgi:hypothetical protein